MLSIPLQHPLPFPIGHDSLEISMASIQSLLTEPPDPEAEGAIVRQFWAVDIQKQNIQKESHKSYFRYYTTERRRLRLGLSKETWDPSFMVATTHEHILLIVRILSLDKTSRQPEVRDLIGQPFPDGGDAAINRSIDFALRVWLTPNVREERLQTPRTPTIQWDDTTMLVDFIAQCFPHRNSTTTTTPQLDHGFTAANMNRLSGIDIEWTPCLADHLRIDKWR